MSKDIEFRLVAWPKFIWNATNLAHSLKLSPKQLKEVKTILRRRNNRWKKQLQVNSAEKHKNEHHRFNRLARWEASVHCPYHYSETMFGRSKTPKTTGLNYGQESRASVQPVLCCSLCKGWYSGSTDDPSAQAMVGGWNDGSASFLPLLLRGNWC